LGAAAGCVDSPAGAEGKNGGYLNQKKLSKRSFILLKLTNRSIKTFQFS
jgi:hypothetical protein